MDSFPVLKTLRVIRKWRIQYNGAYKNNFKQKKYHIETFLMIW